MSDAAIPETFVRLTAGPAANDTRLVGKALRQAGAGVGKPVNETEIRWRRWMLSAASGDTAAYRTLLQEFSVALRRFVARRIGTAHAADVEDIVQEILMAVHAQRRRYDGQRAIMPWVFAIARYKLIDHCRREGRRGVSVPVDSVEDLLAAPEADAGAEDQPGLETLLAHLPAKQRTSLDLVKLQAMSVRNAAHASGMSEAAIRVNVHRGIKTLTDLVRRRRP